MEMPPVPQAMLPVAEGRLHGERTARYNGAVLNPPVPAKSPAISPGVPLRRGSVRNPEAAPVFLCPRPCPEETPPVPVSLRRLSVIGESQYNIFPAKVLITALKYVHASALPVLSCPQACGTAHRRPSQTDLFPSVFPKTVHITQGLYGTPSLAVCPHLLLRPIHPKAPE